MVNQGHLQRSRGCSLSWSLCWLLSLALVGGVHPARHPRYVPTPDINSRMRGSNGQRGSISNMNPLPGAGDFGLDGGGFGLENADFNLGSDITQEIDDGLDYQDEPGGIITTGLALNQPENEQHVNSQANLIRMLQVFPSVVGGYFVEAKRGTQAKAAAVYHQDYDDMTEDELIQRPQVAKLVSLDLPKKKRGPSRGFWYQGSTSAPMVATTTTTKKTYPRSCLFYLKICKS